VLAPFDAVSASGAAEKARRAVLFTNVEASTDLTDRLGDTKARDLLREHERLTREALAAHGGTEIKDDGRWFHGVVHVVHVGLGALDAAIAMQQALTDHFAETATPIRIRVGINAGEPIEEDDDLYGAAVIQAARVMGLADGGQILVTDTVRNLVAGMNYRFADHGTHDLKGFEEPARLFEVGWLSRGDVFGVTPAPAPAPSPSQPGIPNPTTRWSQHGTRMTPIDRTPLQKGHGASARKAHALAVLRGAPGGTRTPDPQIRSKFLVVAPRAIGSTACVDMGVFRGLSPLPWHCVRAVHPRAA